MYNIVGILVCKKKKKLSFYLKKLSCNKIDYCFDLICNIEYVIDII